MGELDFGEQTYPAISLGREFSIREVDDYRN